MLSKSLKLIVLLSLVTTPLSAQQIWGETQRTTFGIRAGFDLQNITGTTGTGNDYDGDLAPAFHIGVVADIPIATDFYIEPGLFYKMKGSNQETSFAGTDFTSKTRIHYLEVPVSLLYKPIVGNGNLILGFGPYLAYGVGGKVEVEGGDNNISNDIEFQNTVEENDPVDVTYVRPWEAGANFTVGYQFMGNLSAQLNAQFGLTDINPEYEGTTDDETSIKNIGFGVSIGYHF